MNYGDAKMRQIAKQLGVSVQALEQYFQLKRAEVSAGVQAEGSSTGFDRPPRAKERPARS